MKSELHLQDVLFLFCGKEIKARKVAECLLLHSPLKHLYRWLFLVKGHKNRQNGLWKTFQAAQDYVNSVSSLMQAIFYLAAIIIILHQV